MFKRKEGKEYKGLKRTPFKQKSYEEKLSAMHTPSGTGTKLKKSKTPIKQIGKQGKKWAKDRAEHSTPERLADGIDWCTLQYEGCWKGFQGNAHSLKRVNRTRPEHDWETIPTCNHCHEILERKGKELMAAIVRGIRQSLGWPIWPEEEDGSTTNT